MPTVNLGTSTSEETHNWVEYGNSPASTQCANMSFANGGITLNRISIGLQAVDLTFIVEYRPGLLSGVTFIHG